MVSKMAVVAVLATAVEGFTPGLRTPALPFLQKGPVCTQALRPRSLIVPRMGYFDDLAKQEQDRAALDGKGNQIMPDSDYTGFVDAEDGFDGGDGQVGVVGDGSNAMEQFDNREVFLASDSMGRPAAGVGSREEGTAGKYGASGGDRIDKRWNAWGTGLPHSTRPSSHHSDLADCSASFNCIVCMRLQITSPAARAFLTHGPDTSCSFSLSVCLSNLWFAPFCLPSCLPTRLRPSARLPASWPVCLLSVMFCTCFIRLCVCCRCCLCVRIFCVLWVAASARVGNNGQCSDSGDDSFKEQLKKEGMEDIDIFSGYVCKTDCVSVSVLSGQWLDSLNSPPSRSCSSSTLHQLSVVPCNHPQRIIIPY